VHIEGLPIGPLRADAAAEGLTLSAEANWNQTAEDWAFFIAHGTVYGARDTAGRLVATAALLPYPAGFAWVSLVIVAKTHRGRGVGSGMLRQCLAVLRGLSLVAMLDATPPGVKVYTPLGFKSVLGLNRWEGPGGGLPAERDRIVPLRESSLKQMEALDAAAFGAPRGAVLTDYWAREGTRGFLIADASGYALVRRGRIAWQLGPVVAGSEQDAVALIENAIAATPGSIFLDVPGAWTRIAAWLEARGFARQRPFLRMALGREAPYGDPRRVFAIAGPEYG
jgi:GNAT superfamily N-acetyltransferase